MNPDASFTARDTPEIRRRVQGDLRTVLTAVRQGDGRLRSLVLTGGFARGEGGFVDGKPHNDYDFVALRGRGRPKVPYAATRRRLQRELGVHVDLAPVPVWRLRWVSPTIFWYETALRGRIVWGEDLLDRIPVRRPEDLQPTEALRLLVNRAAGLLLATERPEDAAAMSTQTAKALLAVLDAELLLHNRFAPSQRERWELFQRLNLHKKTTRRAACLYDDFDWAMRHKLNPDRDPQGGVARWRVAAQAVLDAIPPSLSKAGLRDLEAWARSDGLRDHVVYVRRSGASPDLRRFLFNPTGRVRVATVRLLEESLGGRVSHESARRWLADLAPAATQPVRALEMLRGATLQ